jgi:hypothetical protein
MSDQIRTKPSSREYREGWERAFAPTPTADSLNEIDKLLADDGEEWADRRPVKFEMNLITWLKVMDLMPTMSNTPWVGEGGQTVGMLNELAGIQTTDKWLFALPVVINPELADGEIRLS